MSDAKVYQATVGRMTSTKHQVHLHVQEDPAGYDGEAEVDAFGFAIAAAALGAHRRVELSFDEFVSPGGKGVFKGAVLSLDQT